MVVYDKIISLLRVHNIEYKIFEHEPIVTSEDAARVRGTAPEVGAKSLIFLGDGKPMLLVLSGNRKVDTKRVKEQLGIKDLRMATHHEVYDLTSCEVGGIPPVGTVLNLPTYLDQSFLENEIMDFNAGDRAKSVAMKVQDFVALVKPFIIVLSATPKVSA